MKYYCETCESIFEPGSGVRLYHSIFQKHEGINCVVPGCPGKMEEIPEDKCQCRALGDAEFDKGE